MTVSKFMAIQEALQPDWFQCLSDGEASCAEATSIKRARKSVDRSLQFLDSCLRLQEESEVRPPTSRSGNARLPSASLRLSCSPPASLLTSLSLSCFPFLLQDSMVGSFHCAVRCPQTAFPWFSLFGEGFWECIHCQFPSTRRESYNSTHPGL